MCVVSMVGDHCGDKWEPFKKQNPPPFVPPFPTIYPTQPVLQPASKADVDRLLAEVLEMKELLKRAIQYDKDNNQPHCEQEDKIKFLKQVAESVGVSLDDVFGGNNAAP